MSIKLTLLSTPDVPLEADSITPDKFAGLSPADVAALPLQYGNQKATLGDFFRVEGSVNGEIRVEGDLSRVKLIGSEMSTGRIVIDGSVGMHLGAMMTGGEIVVSGSAGDWVGAEMEGGRIIIHGNAGDMVGSGYRGSAIGVRGGEIIVHGNAGNEVGGAMRRGLIAIGGSAGDFVGVNLRAGTVIVLGQMGWRPGAGMIRGSIISMQPVQTLPTFSYDCLYHPVFLRMYLLYLQQMGLPIEEAHITGQYRRWSGDAVEMNRGEILLFSPN